METSIIKVSFELCVDHLPKATKVDRLCDYIMSVNEHLKEEQSSSHVNQAMIAFYNSELQGAREMLKEYTA